ncbi:hypothetical protein JI735_22070 [Paenibacillus sonchi]|uniref:Uncharacterized protein n=1 Tax=Paenibacillus sonchi TaxID=373687 RepID=A0A974SAC7_9BACL|nr:hypothetical protein [Paenibacillus sonchi]QQZ59338.1 hypothetical protein JI735_22070 [Paenibacillus sonchi]
METEGYNEGADPADIQQADEDKGAGQEPGVKKSYPGNKKNEPECTSGDAAKISDGVR